MLQTRIGGGNFTDVRTQSGVTTFPPGSATVSGNFCYAFRPNTTGIRSPVRASGSKRQMLPQRHFADQITVRPDDTLPIDTG